MPTLDSNVRILPEREALYRHVLGLNGRRNLFHLLLRLSGLLLLLGLDGPHLRVAGS